MCCDFSSIFIRGSDCNLRGFFLQALYIVRFHSFYSHHQHTAYPHLMNDVDHKLLTTLRRFQPCDLYSKSHDFPPLDELRAYYDGLLKEFGLDKPLRFRKMTLPTEAVSAVETFTAAPAPSS